MYILVCIVCIEKNNTSVILQHYTHQHILLWVQDLSMFTTAEPFEPLALNF